MEYTEKKRTTFLALPICFTTYFINEEVVRIRRGFLNIVEDDAYMYKVQDVEHTASLLERIFGLGTVACYTGDTTHPKLLLTHIRNSRTIKDFILRQSEEARRKRRTVNMLDIGSDELEDGGLS